MSDHYLYEFLYRGRPAGDTEPPAWHVVIGQMVQMPGGSAAQFVSSGPLTPEQAEAAGYPLSAVLDGINAAALAGRDAAAADAEAARRERDAALADAARAAAQRDLAVGERDALAAQIAALTAPVQPSADLGSDAAVAITDRPSLPDRVFGDPDQPSSRPSSAATSVQPPAGPATSASAA